MHTAMKLPMSEGKVRAQYKRGALALFAVGIGAGAFFLLDSRAPEAQPASVSAQPTGTRITDRAGQRDVVSIGTTERLASTPQPQRSKSELVEDLIRSKDPAQAYQALKILNACTKSQSAELESQQSSNPAVRAFNDQQYGHPKEMCGDLLPNQLAMRPRLALLAAEARIPGAYGIAIQLVNENPDYQELQATLERVVDSYIKAADPLALSSQAEAYANCSDPPVCTGTDFYKALEYRTAYLEVRPRSGPDSFSDFLAQKLGEDKAHAAVTAGKALVAAAGRKQ